MTIRRGESWGRVIERPPGIHVVTSDAELGRIVEERLGSIAESADALCVTGGDLARTVGVAEVPAGPQVRSVPIDILRIGFDGCEAVAVAHVVLRRRHRLGLTGPIHVICNAEYLGGLDVAPRAHPNDGFADVLDLDPTMAFRQRWLARKRATTGTHIPHPGIRMRRLRSGLVETEEHLGIWIDGVYRGSTTRMEFAVVADAFEILVG